MANIASLGDFQKKDEEKKEENAYYAGGASAQGGSGLSVIGGDGNDPPNAVDGIFNRAAGAPGQGPGPSGDAQTVTITMYQNGFTVNDGPFRALDDPANQPFLQDMAKGVVPRELEANAGSTPLGVNLVDKRGEAYEAPPPPSYVAYAGEGQALGETKVADGAVSSVDDGVVDPPVVDESLPTTTLQIRTHNGKRIRAKLNLTHTVQHIQALIRAEGAGDAPYILMTGFPPAQITDFTQTIEEAGLKGAQITQKSV